MVVRAAPAETEAKGLMGTTTTCGHPEAIRGMVEMVPTRRLTSAEMA